MTSKGPFQPKAFRDIFLSFSHSPSFSCRGLDPAGNERPCGHSVAPPLCGVGRRMGRKRQNSWVGIGMFNRTAKEANGNKNTNKNK